jgi:hypothetical protein
MANSNKKAGGTFAFTPRKAIAWRASFKDATRWEF